MFRPLRAVILPCAALALLATALPTGRAQAADAYVVMSHDKRFRTWTNMIDTADLVGYARGKHPYTIFAVVEDSIANIDPDLMKAIGPRASPGGLDVSQLTFVVQSHVVLGKVAEADMAGKTTTLKSVNGKPILIDATKTPAQVSFIGSEGVLAGAPILADNAIIYPVLLKSAHYVRE